MKLYRIFSLLLCLILLILIEGCSFENGPFLHSFRQDRANIVSVGIYEYDKTDKSRVEVIEFTDSEEAEVLNRLAEMDCYRYFPYLNHIRTYGELMICITYMDGEVELIGLHNIGYITQEGTQRLTNDYFDWESMYELIGQYVDIESYWD